MTVRPGPVAAVLLVVVLGLAGLGLTDLPARWLMLEDPRTRVDAAVILAGDPDYERTQAGAELVRSGTAHLLVLTGGEPGPGDSAESLRVKALAWGVPGERIRLETVSRGTRESLLAVAPILRQENVRTVALVTSPYHQRRAFLLARRVLPDLEVFNCPARPSSWSPRAWWRESRSRRIVISEYAKIFYSALRGWL
ncbi:MAG TPA: YdcF family protein [Vicinamibacteria bacterium]|nr:YdcF family protein [Vicinamibacteria bacterium]